MNMTQGKRISNPLPRIPSLSDEMMSLSNRMIPKEKLTTRSWSLVRANNEGVRQCKMSNHGKAIRHFESALSKLEKKLALTQSNSPCGERSRKRCRNETLPGALTISQEKRRASPRVEYDEGMNAHTELFRLDSKAMKIINHEAIPTQMISLVINLGQAYTASNMDREAESCFLHARTIFMDHPTIDCWGEVTLLFILHRIGYLQFRIGEFEEAITTYNEALLHCRHPKKSGVKVQLDAASTMNCLGVVYFHLQKSHAEKALECLLNALSIRRELLGSRHPDVATTLNNIGRVNYINGQLDNALRMYDEALGIRRELFGSDHLDVAATVCNAGQAYHQRGELNTALRLYEEFVRIVMPRLGKNHRDIFLMYKCMAQAHQECGDHERALSCYSEALSVGRSALGTTNHVEIASILNKMGNLYYRRDDYDHAIEMYREGLEIERVVLDDTHPNITVTLSNIGQIHKQRGEYADALKIYGEALTIQTETLGASNPSVAVTLSNIGLIHYQRGRFSESLNFYQETLRIRREAFGEDNLEVASVLNSIGLVLFKLGVYDLAKQSFMECLTLRRKLLGNDHREVAVILYNVGTIYLEEGDEEKAIECYRETLRVERAVLAPYHDDVLLTIQYLAQVHQQRGDLKEALVCFEELLTLQRRRRQQQQQQQGTNGENEDVPIARTMNSIANVQLLYGHSKEVVEAMSEATRIMRKAGRGDEELTLTGFDLYEVARLHPECAATA